MSTNNSNGTNGSSAPPERHIVIIGGGIIGCTTAYFLTRHPAYDPAHHRITLLEASGIAGGASGKAGGLLALWAYPSSIVLLSYRLHQELASEHGGATRWGYRAVHCAQVECVGRRLEDGEEDDGGELRRTRREAVDANPEPTDDDPEHVSLQKRSREAMKKLRASGVPADLDWLHPDCVRAYDEMGDPSTTAQVHPLHFTSAMAELAREKGVEIHIHSPVSRINYTDSTPSSVSSVTYTDDTTQTEITLNATDIIVAAGPWTRSILPSAPIAALRAHSVTIRPSRPVPAYALFTQIRLPPSFHPSNRRSGGGTIVSPEIYTRPGNEVYACGEGDRLEPLPSTSAAVAVDPARCRELVDHVSSLSPVLRDGAVLVRQACYLPNVIGSGDPLIGFTGTKGLLLAAGHTCWGIQNGPATGKLVSEFVFDGEAKSADVRGLDPRRVM